MNFPTGDDISMFLNLIRHNNYYTEDNNLIYNFSDYDISRILKTANQSIFNFTREKFYENDFINIPINFALEKICSESEDFSDLEKCKRFCAYFEYVFTEFNYWFYNDYKAQAQLTVSELSRKYCNYKSNNTAGDVDYWLSQSFEFHKSQALNYLFRNTDPLTLQDCEDRSNYDLCKDVIIRMANVPELRYKSLPSAVYHWRKHCTYKSFPGYREFTAYGYFEKSNEIVRNGILVSDSQFEFTQQEGNGFEFYVNISKNEPHDLVTCFRRLRTN